MWEVGGVVVLGKVLLRWWVIVEIGMVVEVVVGLLLR